MHGAKSLDDVDASTEDVSWLLDQQQFIAQDDSGRETEKTADNRDRVDAVVETGTSRGRCRVYGGWSSLEPGGRVRGAWPGSWRWRYYLMSVMFGMTPEGHSWQSLLRKHIRSGSNLLDHYLRTRAKVLPLSYISQACILRACISQVYILQGCISCKAIQIKQQPQADRYHKPCHRRGR
jgi:hypothetical protein